MPIALPPATTSPIVPSVQTQWVRARFTTSTGFIYDASNLLRSLTINRGRSSQYETSISAATCNAVFDDTAGVLDPDNTSSPMYGKLTLGPQSATTFRVDAWTGDFAGWVPMFTGPIDSLERSFTGGDYSETQAGFVDSTAGLARHVPPADLILPAELPGARISRLLSTTSRSGFNWTSRALTAPTAIDTGQKILGAYTCDGSTSSWDIALGAAQAEDGLLYFDEAGVLVFHGQARRLENTVNWTLSDDGEHIFYESDLTLKISTGDLIVDAAVTTADKVTSIYGPGGASRQDDTKAATGVSADLTEQSQIAGNITGAARARHLYTSRSVAKRNAPAVTVNPAPLVGQWTSGGQPSGWQLAVQGRIDDLCQLVRTPTTGTQITALHWIEGVSHDIQAGDHWTTTFNVSRADPLPPNGYWKFGVSYFGSHAALTW